MAWRGPNQPINNPVPNPLNHGDSMSGEKANVPNAGFPYKENRSSQVRRDTDEKKDFSVKLIDIDTTILSYMDTVISPTIIDAGRQVKVPINYASPERWKAIRKDGAIRDRNGKVQCPAIAFRRSTVQRNDSMTTFNRYLQYPVVKRFSEKNKYDKFGLMNGFAPVKEVYSVAMPDHIIVNYDFIVWTDLIEQGNSIVEGINFSTEDYWGDKTRFKFRTSISDYNFETTADVGQDRLVRTTFSLMVYAYLLPDRYENYKSVVEKAFTPRKIIITTETVLSNPNDFCQQPQSTETYSITPSNPSTIGFFESGKLPAFPAIVQNSDHAFSADFASTAGTINHFTSTGSISLGGLTITGNGVSGSFAVNSVSGINGSGAIDSVQFSAGNAAKWLVSINDGLGGNFKTTEVIAAWNMVGTTQFYATAVGQVGSVPVSLSVNNSGGVVNLFANVMSGTWNIKYVRTVL